MRAIGERLGDDEAQLLLVLPRASDASSNSSAIPALSRYVVAVRSTTSAVARLVSSARSRSPSHFAFEASISPLTRATATSPRRSSVIWASRRHAVALPSARTSVTIGAVARTG